MQEKDMVNDILGSSKASLGNYAKVIVECSNKSLREKFQTMRDNDEKFQYDLYSVAAAKGYYIPAESATKDEINTVKDNLQQQINQACNC